MAAIIIYRLNAEGCTRVLIRNGSTNYFTHESQREEALLSKGKVTQTIKSQPDKDGNVYLTLIIES